MNRRKFIQTSGLVTISTLVLNNKLQAFSFSNKQINHLWIDLGAVRFQDVISKQDQTAMPEIIQLITNGDMLLDTYEDYETSKKRFATHIKDKAFVFNLNLLDGNTYNPKLEFYDTFLIKKAFDYILHFPQDLYVRIYQTEMAHYNIPSYRLLLSQIDKLISNYLNNFNQAGIKIHVYSSSGRNLLPDENGGLHHHSTDSNTSKTFYIQSNEKLLSA
ncbi:MAG: hypothetical protein N2167_02670 [Flavobacteriales bacterium]|nr:hypothetical protein [Flavobacteriales bacterium]